MDHLPRMTASEIITTHNSPRKSDTSGQERRVAETGDIKDEGTEWPFGVGSDVRAQIGE